MDFQTFATEELIALAKKLADAAEARIHLAAAAAAAGAKADADAEVARVRALADAEAERTRSDAEAAVSRLTADVAAERGQWRAGAEAEAARIRNEAAQEIAVARDTADAEIAALKLALDAETARTAVAIAAETARLRTAAEAEGGAMRAASEAEVGAIRAAAEAEVAAIRAAADTAAKTSGAYGAMVEKLRTTQTGLEAENERLAAENAALTWERREVLESAQASHRGALITRLATVFDGVASAATVEDVLSRAAAGLDGDFARVAVFTVRDNRLVLTDRRGFDANSGIEKVVVSLGVESFLSEAAQAREVRMLHGSTLPGAAPFGGAPGLIVTAPIGARGETLGVIYADDSGRPMDAASAQDSLRLAGLLCAHAALRLERLTIELKAITELRAYAKMLIDEVEYVYDADTASRKPDAERIGRLQENLRCARQIYQQRVTLEGPAAAALLDDVILHTVDRKAATQFGREMGAVLTENAPEQAGRTVRAS